ncbi:MAG: hypothetical protein KDE09_09185 [Anaerolineales bacterium]|nr:hypothetical protein [Anaerolineales bacterium]MCB8962694.1 hypothetical protein [Ardenticatenales bacterium]MCB0008223.1 hypothetical protein [Anaerolineales bacterium]MCB0012607.1 hypothetical protein [Anaerolineales bacterium]MCB0017949.1 hypothetical protein [Anaerolineales bacterium]
MANTELNDDQRRILRTLVEHARAGRLDGYFHPMPTERPAEYVVHLKGAPSYRFVGLPNLQFLAQIGLLDAKWDRSGMGQSFVLNEASFAAVEQAAAAVRVTEKAEHDLAAIIHAMTGGQMLLSNSANQHSFAQALNDVEARDRLIDDLCQSLRKEVMAQLPKERQVAYDNSLIRLNTMLKSAFSNPASVQECIRELAFMDGQRVDPQLLPRPWPFLYPILLIFADRLTP